MTITVSEEGSYVRIARFGAEQRDFLSQKDASDHLADLFEKWVRAR